MNSQTKLELLNSMVAWQEERTHIGKLTPDLIERGMSIFQELDYACETEDLHMLTRSYLRYLKAEQKLLKYGHLRVVS